MFDKLIALIQQFGSAVSPFTVIDMWENAIMLRLGKFHKHMRSGFYFKIPFADSVWKTSVITQSIEMPPQSITTADDKNVVVRGIIRYRVYDVVTFLTTIMEPKDVLTDTAAGMIREIVEVTKWSKLSNIDQRLTEEVGEFVKNWGIDIEKVTLTDLQIANSIRLIQDSGHNSKILPTNEIA